MIKLRVAILTLTVLAGLHAECIPGGMAVVVNKANPTESVSMAQLRKLILGDVRTWPDKKPVTVVTRDISGNLFKCVLVSIVRMTDAEYRRYILSAEFRGEDLMATKSAVSGSGAARIISAVAGAISVIPASELPSMADSVRVVRINGKEPGEAGYPLD